MAPPTSEVPVEGYSTYQSTLNKSALLFVKEDKIKLILLFGTLFMTFSGYILYKIVWRSLAGFCFAEIFKTKSIANKSIMLSGVPMGAEDNSHVLMDLLIPNSQGSEISCYTIGYDIRSDYKTIKRYLIACRKLERIEKYRVRIARNPEATMADIDDAYPPTMCYAPRIISSYKRFNL